MEIKLEENLLTLIKKSGRDTKSIALELGIPTSTLHDYCIKKESRTTLNFLHIYKLCQFFNVSMEELVYSLESKTYQKLKEIRELVKSIDI